MAKIGKITFFIFLPPFNLFFIIFVILVIFKKIYSYPGENKKEKYQAIRKLKEL